jgi:hypothetical protein
LFNFCWITNSIFTICRWWIWNQSYSSCFIAFL